LQGVVTKDIGYCFVKLGLLPAQQTLAQGRVSDPAGNRRVWGG
jgi:hypothetical protein